MRSFQARIEEAVAERLAGLQASGAIQDAELPAGSPAAATTGEGRQAEDGRRRDGARGDRR